MSDLLSPRWPRRPVECGTPPAWVLSAGAGYLRGRMRVPDAATMWGLLWASPGWDKAMRSPALLFAVALAVLAGPATAQLPFGTPPLPESGVRRQCSKDYLASLEAQA